jgi:hypothetical protein
VFKIYGVILNDNKKIYDDIFFIFFAEKYLEVFSVTSIWEFSVTKKHQKTSINLVVKYVTLVAVKRATGTDILLDQNI